MLRLTLLLILLTAPARAERPRLDGLVDDDGGFLRATPSAEALARYQAGARYSREHAGLALLVIDEDAVVFEEAENGYDLRRGHHLWSGTKTFACVLAMAAVAEGRLTLDEHPAESLPELQDDPREAAIRVRDLLSFTSGLDHGHLVAEPGSVFGYVADHLAVFAELVLRKLGEDPLGYLERRVLAPIGFRYSGWRRDSAGHALWGIGLYTTPRSWARLGVLLRDDGRFRGHEVLPPGLLAQCLRGSAAMPAYGLTLWLNESVPGPLWHHVPGVLVGPFAREGRVLSPEGPADLFAAVGYQDNRLYVVPSRRLIIVRFGAGDARFEDARLLTRLLGSSSP